MQTAYEKDIIAWSKEQAQLLRSGKLSAIDIEHIAEEIEDVGKSEQRKAIARRIKNTSSLKVSQNDPEWLDDAWGDAVSIAIVETGISHFPEACPWNIENILSETWLPSAQ